MSSNPAFSLVPAPLVSRDQWVNWAAVEKPDGKWTKEPRRASSPAVKASTTDPRTWSPFHEAVRALKAGRGSVMGIGYVVTATDRLTGIDLDKCRDDQTGKLDPQAVAIVDRFSSYTEITPSRRGVRIWIRGTLPPGSRNRKGNIEIYSNERYFTVTGIPLDGSPLTIEERQAELEELLAELGFLPSATGDQPTTSSVSPKAVDLDDQALLERAFSARNGAQFERLWNGDKRGYEGDDGVADDSRADLALCGHLSFWTGGDPNRIDSLFRRSGLMRGKWDERRGDTTYGQITIRRALEGRTEYYAPNAGRETLSSTSEAAAASETIVAAIRTIILEPWATFRDAAEDEIPCLIDGLWPVGSLAFIAAPPKAGKTWLGLIIALSLATARKLFGRFVIPEARPVLYVALEGHRAALRARIACLARGLDLDPEGDDLRNLHLAYKPRGINLAEASWALELADRAREIDAALVIVDVLRSAAIIRENEASDFAALRRNLEPLLDAGCSVALLHHFGKLTELSKERTPAERMAGSGAMHGALDVGLYITGVEQRGRRMRVEIEERELASPDPFGIRLIGEGSGHNGSFTHKDTCAVAIVEPPDEQELKAPPTEIAEFVLAQNGRRVGAKEIREQFDITDDTLRRRRDDLEKHGVTYISAGALSGYEPIPDTTLKLDLNPAFAPRPATPRHRGVDDRGVANPHGYAKAAPRSTNPATQPIAGSENA